jgi:CheY-like chemotaxis protein
MNEVLKTTYKVLVVDDEEKSVKYFKQFFQDKLTVLTAGSVDEAIFILDTEHENIGVLVTDQRMPGKSGVSLLQYARENYPQITRIMTTAYADLTDAIAAVNSGEIFRYIKKPWLPDQLIIDVSIAMSVFTLKMEREELIAAKITAYQQVVILGRVKDLYVLCAAIQTQWPLAQSALKNFLTNAILMLKGDHESFSIGANQLNFGRNLVVETERSASLMQHLPSLLSLKSSNMCQTPLQNNISQLFREYARTLNWSEPPTGYNGLLNALCSAYRDVPMLEVRADRLEIKGLPAQHIERLWGTLTSNAGDDLTQALQWLCFHLWAHECGLKVNMQTHSSSELVLTLSHNTDSLQGFDAEWLDDLYGQFV